MPTARISRNIAAGATDDNLVAGRSVEIAAQDGSLTIAAACAVNTMTMQARLTDEVVVDNSSIPNVAGGNPIIPDHALLVDQPVAQSDRLIVSVTNNDAAAQDVRVLISLTYL